MHLQLRLKIILPRLNVTRDLGRTIALHTRQHLTGSALLPIHDRTTQADTPEIRIHTPNTHTLHTPRKTQNHLSERH